MVSAHRFHAKGSERGQSKTNAKKICTRQWNQLFLTFSDSLLDEPADEVAKNASDCDIHYIIKGTFFSFLGGSRAEREIPDLGVLSFPTALYRKIPPAPDAMDIGGELGDVPAYGHTMFIECFEGPMGRCILLVKRIEPLPRRVADSEVNLGEKLRVCLHREASSALTTRHRPLGGMEGSPGLNY